MRSRRANRKLLAILQIFLFAITVLVQMLYTAFVALFRKTDLMIIRYNRTIQVCLIIGFLCSGGSVIYAALNHWPWYVDVFAGWQIARLLIFAGSLLLDNRDDGYEYVDGRRWR